MRWEYLVIQCGWGGETGTERELDILGAAGWEMTGVVRQGKDRYVYYFKRFITGDSSLLPSMQPLFEQRQ